MIKNHFERVTPERYEFLLARKWGLATKRRSIVQAQLSPNKIKEVMNFSFSFTVNGSLPIEKGFVTGGGVHLKE